MQTKLTYKYLFPEDKMQYTEEKSASLKYRRDYYNGINAVIDARRNEVDKIRAEYINPEKAAADREKYRRDLTKILGWPLTKYEELKSGAMKVIKEKRTETDDAVVYSMQFEILPDCLFYGLFFENKNKTDNTPFVIAQHGGAGGPETISEMWGPSNYCRITDRLLSHGANVFCPGLLLWATEDAPEGIEKYRPQGKDERDYADFRLRQLGGSITAVEIFAIRRIIEYFIAGGFAHEGHIGMTGLSYGCFYTMMTTALETKINAAYASCQFSNRYTFDQWPDWIFDGIGEKFLDAEVASLVAPRPLFIEQGDGDEVFKAEPFLAECKRTEPFYKAAGAEDKLKYRVFTGGHQFADDDTGVKFLIDNLKLS